MIFASFSLKKKTARTGDDDGYESNILFVCAGTTIDQGIACLLMLVALVLTYLIHPLDA